jgi:ribosomal protein S18 acetylase RimI-like enzyme
VFRLPLFGADLYNAGGLAGAKPFHGSVQNMSETTADVQIRCLEDTDLGEITGIDEKMGGSYRPEVWEQRMAYYSRRDPEASLVAESAGRVVGFMFGEIRSGEFGMEEPTGWIEVLGVDPEARGRNIGRRLAEQMMDYFRQSGAQVVRTMVEAEMVGIERFFESLGFEPASLRPFVKRLSS